MFFGQVSEFQRMPKDTSRSAYTRRIMEILVNIKKQKEEIGKVNLIAICLEINIQDCFVTDIGRYWWT